MVYKAVLPAAGVANVLAVIDKQRDFTSRNDTAYAPLVDVGTTLDAYTEASTGALSETLLFQKKYLLISPGQACDVAARVWLILRLGYWLTDAIGDTGYARVVAELVKTDGTNVTTLASEEMLNVSTTSSTEAIAAAIAELTARETLASSEWLELRISVYAYQNGQDTINVRLYHDPAGGNNLIVKEQIILYKEATG